MPTENNIFPFYNQKDSWHITDSFKPKTHTQMQFKKENILKAHKEGCEDVKKFIELAAPELFPKKEKTYKIGDVFENTANDDRWRIMRVKMHVVSLMGISEYNNTESYDHQIHTVENDNCITESEFKNIAGLDEDDFTLIED